MAKAPVALTSLSEEQRAEAYARFELLRPVLEEGVFQAHIVRTHQLSKSAVQRSPYRPLSNVFGHGCWKTTITGSMAKQGLSPRIDGKSGDLSLGCPSLLNGSTCCS